MWIAIGILEGMRRRLVSDGYTDEQALRRLSMDMLVYDPSD